MSKVKGSISDLYCPLQPPILNNVEQVAYREHIPDPRLRESIYCYWELYTTEKLTNPFSYRVVADGCIDIFFSVKPPVESYIMGLWNKSTEFSLGTDFHYAGIRFYPAVVPALFNVGANEIANSVEKLSLVSLRTAEFIEKSVDAFGLTTLKGKLNQYFLSMSANVESNVDHRFSHVLHTVLSARGISKIEPLLDFGLSTRQLRRYFEKYIGDSPKQFSRIIRFQNFLSRLKEASYPDYSLLLYEAGYYDQPHFIKEFRALYGEKPSKVF